MGFDALVSCFNRHSGYVNKLCCVMCVGGCGAAGRVSYSFRKFVSGITCHVTVVVLTLLSEHSCMSIEAFTLDSLQKPC